MACRGSGVRVPSGPPKNPRLNGGFLVSERRSTARNPRAGLDGERHRTKIVAKSFAAGERELKKRLPELIAQTSTEPGDEETDTPVLFPQAAERFITNEALRWKNGVTARGTHKEHVRLTRSILIPTLRDIPVREITPQLVATLYDTWVAQWPPRPGS